MQKLFISIYVKKNPEKINTSLIVIKSFNIFVRINQGTRYYSDSIAKSNKIFIKNCFNFIRNNTPTVFRPTDSKISTCTITRIWNKLRRNMSVAWIKYERVYPNRFSKIKKEKLHSRNKNYQSLDQMDLLYY